MAIRGDHTFQFKASEIRDAADRAAAYHEKRETYWREEQERAAKAALEGAGVELRRYPVTGGERIDFAVNLGDAAEGQRTQEAFGKAERHRQEKERFLTEEKIYGSQCQNGSNRTYELSADDIHYFNLTGEPSEE